MSLIASIVAGFQSLFGVNRVFSLLQSAPMGGFGGPILAAGVRLLAGAGTVVNFVLN